MKIYQIYLWNFLIKKEHIEIVQMNVMEQEIIEHIYQKKKYVVQNLNIMILVMINVQVE